MQVGYLLEGMYLYWYIDLNMAITDEDNVILETVYTNNYISVWDYEYDMIMEQVEINTPTAQTFTAVPTAQDSTATPTMTAVPTLEILPEASPTTTAEIAVTNRQNPMLWLLVIVIALAIVAAGLIVKIITKKDK